MRSTTATSSARQSPASGCTAEFRATASLTQAGFPQRLAREHVPAALDTRGPPFILPDFRAHELHNPCHIAVKMQGNAQILPYLDCIKALVDVILVGKVTSAMIAQTLPHNTPRILPRRRKVVHVAQELVGFDAKDALSTIREYRLRKVASKRIPSRIS